jgi:hypothetical protein
MLSFNPLLIIFGLITLVLFILFIRNILAFRSWPREEESEAQPDVQQMLDQHFQDESERKDLSDEKT